MIILGEASGNWFYLRLGYDEIPGFLDKLLEIIDLDESKGFCNKEQLIFIASMTSSIEVANIGPVTLKLSKEDYSHLLFIFKQIESPVAF